MRLMQLPASRLRPGMFVAELDRPWRDTSFAVPGFLVLSDEDVDAIAGQCEFVYVDASHEAFADSDPEPTLLQPRAAPVASVVAPAPMPQATPVPAPRPELALLPLVEEVIDLTAEPAWREAPADPAAPILREDFCSARNDFTHATQVLERVLDDLRRARGANLEDLAAALAPLVEGVYRNVDAVAASVRARHTGAYLYRHGIAMAVWAAILGRQIGLDRSQLDALALGCALADAGMVNMPAAIFDRAERLGEVEAALVRRHPELGVALLRRNGPCDPGVLDVVAGHQERWDGSGYPKGLRGTEAPLFARIAGLVDVYDAMITPRPWSNARSSFDATAELAETKDVLFQGALVEQFVQAVGVFPTGALVELNTGEVGIVVRQNVTRRMKPDIVRVLDADKRRSAQPLAIDLASAAEGPVGGVWITRELPRGAYGIASEDYFV